jgi:hypothetical protein
MNFRTYQTNYWRINYPASWDVEQFENGISFFDDKEGVGSLQISGYLKDEKVTSKDIDELFEDETPGNSELKKRKIGIFEGYSTEYNYEDQFWRMWFLTKDKLLLCITYNCELEDREIEKEIINQIISTLE